VDKIIPRGGRREEDTGGTGDGSDGGSGSDAMVDAAFMTPSTRRASREHHLLGRLPRSVHDGHALLDVSAV